MVKETSFLQESSTREIIIFKVDGGKDLFFGLETLKYRMKRSYMSSVLQRRSSTLHLSVCVSVRMDHGKGLGKS